MAIDPIYQAMIRQVLLDSEIMVDAQMKVVYSAQKQALNSLNTSIGELFITYSTNGLLLINSVKKAKIIAEFKAKLKLMGKELGQKEIDTVTDILANVFKDSYYKQAFINDIGIKMDLKFSMLKSEYIESAINQKLHGNMFSTRIWKNKASMINQLQASIVECMKGKTSIDKVGRQIRDTFNVTSYQSKRLVHTEAARVSSQASIDIAKNIGIKQHMWDSTLDSKTSEFCQLHDGKIYDVDDDSIGIPKSSHPKCRCCWCNISYTGWTPTSKKDNISKEIIPYQQYAEWAKSKGL